MKKNKNIIIGIVMIIILILAGGIFLFKYLNRGEISNEKYCEKDEDCVPAQCCHATDVVNKKFAPNCGGIFCTQECQSPLDCGCGEPICIDNQCSIKKTSNESYCY